MDIVLASKSPSRKMLLENANIPFRISPSYVDESKIKNSLLSHEEICLKLAEKKAEVIQKKYPNSLIIGSDQLISFKNKIYGKSKNDEGAFQMLNDLQGSTHKLINALYMVFEDKKFHHLSVNEMSMRKLNEHQIKKYIEKDKPFYSAGSYLIDRGGLALFEKIESKDFSSIIGFPITVIINQLVEWGFPYLQD